MCLFSERACALCACKYRETWSLRTRTYVHKIMSAALNIFWFPTLCSAVGGGYLHVM